MSATVEYVEDVKDEVLTGQVKNCAPDLKTQIAECAYYKALSRGFQPGHELDDWLAAERQF